MSEQKIFSIKKKTFYFIFLFPVLLILTGCSGKTPLPQPQGLSQSYQGPQISITPEKISLGITTLLKTPILVAGKGFDPGDIVFVDLFPAKDAGKKPSFQIALGESHVDDSGGFLIQVSREVKVLDILKATMDPGDKIPIIVGEPIPPGIYEIRALSVNSVRRAICLFIVQAPDKLDRIKDKLGIVSGKIKKGR